MVFVSPVDVTILKKDLEMFSTITAACHAVELNAVELNVGEIRLRLRGKLILGGGCYSSGKIDSY